MAPASIVSWLYDVKLTDQGIHFTALRSWTLYCAHVDNIESIIEVGVFPMSALSACNFKNRLLSRTLLVTLKHGWFARKILITPRDPDCVFLWARAHKISTA